MHYIRAVCLSLSFTGIMLLWASIAVSPATATLVTFNFTGTVDTVGSNLSGTFSTGQTLTGSYTYDSTKLDSNPSPTIGTYAGPIQTMAFNIGSYSATLGAGGNSIKIQNLGGFDSYTSTASFLGSSVNGNAPSFFEINLKDSSHTAFSNDSLPTTPPSLSSFDTKTFRLVFGNGLNPNNIVSGVLTAVPLPAAVILFGAGLVALVGLGAGSWRQKKTSLA